MDGQTDRTTDGPVQTNKVRCHVPIPAPCCAGPAGGQCGHMREETGQEALASVQARYCCCRLVGCPHAPGCLWLLALCGSVALWPPPLGGTRGPVRAPPIGAFQKQGMKLQESMASFWGRKRRHGTPCSNLRRTAVRRDNPHPCTLLHLLPPVLCYLPYYLLFVPDTQTVMSSFLSLNQSDHLFHHPQHI